ncbi:MAG TPA: tRNA (N6-isopentenyl adenosine(37)-C2)-methylthiotransferase MiaB, partial [Cyclobacteriaceae bacterium]|nr:tRNA (N6-isopentenyl adenosine(37)-C2)-methylthiotransferase MiaB [Cyclobacteriaceae bacterium]
MENLTKDIEVLSGNEAVANNPGQSSAKPTTGKSRKLYIESYGCQMNFSDSEIVASVLKKDGFETTSDITEADVVFLNTCSIRDKAEQTVRNRLHIFRREKKKKAGALIGVLGCMAERLKAKL